MNSGRLGQVRGVRQLGNGWRGLLLLLAVVMFFAAVGRTPQSEAAAKRSAKGAVAKQGAIEGIMPTAKGFVLLFTGDWRGQLEPCGCADKQLGGIDRRTAIIQAIGAEGRLLLDVGSLIVADDRPAELKFEVFLESLGRLGYDGMGMTGREIALFEALDDMDKEGYPKVICSNMPSAKGEKMGLVAAQAKTLRFGKEKLDCLVLSVTADVESYEEPLAAKLELQEPVEAVRAVLADKLGSADKRSADKLVVVLAPVNDNGLVDSLAKIGAIDMVATQGSADDPEFCRAEGGRAAVLTVGRLGKYIARLDVATGSGAGWGDFVFREVAIEEDFARDRDIAELIEDYQMSLQAEDLIGSEDNLLARAVLRGGNSFAGNVSCGASDCHEEIYTKWKEFRHAKAMEALEDPNRLRAYDPACVVCHTVGMKYESGYRSMAATGELAGVGCEMCHGPGAQHNEFTSELYQEIFTSCEDCHNHETSPQFEKKREEYFEKIRHWEEARKYWD